MIEKIVTYIEEERKLDKDESMIFKYGFELLLNMMANFLLVIMIGSLWGYPIQSVLFYCCYVFVKKDSGGYHAKSHLSCVFQFNMVYFTLVALYKFFVFSKTVMFLIIVMTIFSVFQFAPIVSKQKKLTEMEVALHRRGVRVKSVILCSMWFVGEIMFHNSYTDFIFLSVCMLEITILLGKILD